MIQMKTQKEFQIFLFKKETYLKLNVPKKQIVFSDLLLLPIMTN